MAQSQQATRENALNTQASKSVIHSDEEGKISYKEALLALM